MSIKVIAKQILMKIGTMASAYCYILQVQL